MRRSLSIALAGAAAAAGYLLLARRAAKGTARSDLATRALVHHHLPAMAMPLGTAGSAVGHPAMYHVVSWAAWRWLRARDVDGAWLVPAAALATWASYRVTKLFVARDRPPGDHTRDMDASYPSGHTSGTTAVTLAIAHLLARSGKVPPGRLLPFVVGVPLVVGASRVLMDEHWASDVAGGWLLGAAVTALTVPLAGPRGG